MVVLSLVTVAFLWLVLLLVSGAVPRKSALSLYELRRRQDEGSTSASEELRRLAAVNDIISLQRVLEGVCLVLIAGILVSQWGVIGILIALIIALLYKRISKVEFIRVVSQRVYDEFDEKLIRFTEKYPQVGKVITGVAGEDERVGFGSRQELEHMIDESAGIVTIDEKKLLKSNLHFADKTVEMVMTPRGVIEAVDAHEVLGPIVLDQLHKTGHSRFPVMKEDIDHIVGVLHIRELLALHEKTSQIADQAMEKKVFYINQAQSLQHALAAFLSTRHHLFVVVNEYRETAGVITLEDCIEALIGRKIVDEFDSHDDLRAAAMRNAKHNNNAPGTTNV